MLFCKWIVFLQFWRIKAQSFYIIFVSFSGKGYVAFAIFATLCTKTMHGDCENI